MYLLYNLSAVIGVALSGAMFFAGAMGGLAIPILGGLIWTVIAISIMIEYNKDNPLQDWLGRCPWEKCQLSATLIFETQHAELTRAL